MASWASKSCTKSHPSPGARPCSHCRTGFFTFRSSSWAPPLFLTRTQRTTVLALQDRLLYVPLKLMGTSTIFDPDTEDDLRDIAFDFEQTSEKIPRAAAKLDFGETRRYYDRCVNSLNKFYAKVNKEIGAPKGSEFYLELLP